MPTYILLRKTRLSWSVCTKRAYVFCFKVFNLSQKHFALCSQTARTRKSVYALVVLFSIIPIKKDSPEVNPFLLAEDETRTRDSLLGRQILYQLSYFRTRYLYPKINKKKFQAKKKDISVLKMVSI